MDSVHPPSAACQPLFGQVADIFSRRWLVISIITFYVFGSGVCGGADGAGMLIAGRAIHGIGCKRFPNRLAVSRL
jgi:MFS family permease